MGLGAMLGTGIFISIGLAWDVAGQGLIVAIALAGLVAICNGLSSARLAAAYPVSGGTYEYAHRTLTPAMGAVAGWMFLIAKSASAAAAALGFAHYLLRALDQSESLTVVVAIVLVLLLTAVTFLGMKPANRLNTLIVIVTVSSLIAYVALLTVEQGSSILVTTFRQSFDLPSIGALLECTAIVFVAFTGYGRIATLGEEVRSPESVIPRAILITVIASIMLYLAVSLVTIGMNGFKLSPDSGQALLTEVAMLSAQPGLVWIMTVGAMTAMIAVLLNLLLGLSRVMLAMGRRGHLPKALGRVDQQGQTPITAVPLTGLLILALVWIGDFGLAWRLSAFTVLVYYALTNLAAIRLKQRVSHWQRLLQVLGLLSCVVLSVALDLQSILTGLMMIAAALIAHRVSARYRRG